ncbi:MAG: phospholipase [Gemmatimonadetes bacterium]|nr:phospholipase [Gemmatimonadota bacterium]
MTEPADRHLEVRRSARIVELGAASSGLRQVWIVCHGYGQLARRFLRRFEPIADGSRLIVAPEALNRFYLDGGTGPHGPESRVGATWMTREDRLADIEDYVRYLDAVHDDVFGRVDRAAVALHVLGFSQGTATVARWGARTRARIDRLLLWSGTLPPELALTPDTFRGARLTFVLGDRDPWASPATIDATRARVETAGLDFDLVRFDGGHDLDAVALARLA